MKKRRGKQKPTVLDEDMIPIDLVETETVCAVCSAEFLDEDDLKLHIIQMHLNEANGKSICRFCYAILSDADEFVTHFIHKHLTSTFFCFYCYRAFTNTKDLEQHELKHCAVQGNPSVTCSQCSKIFSNKQKLGLHEFKQHADVEGVMLNNVFPLLSSALNMQVTVFLDSLCKQKPFTCIVCRFQDLEVTDYIQHLRLRSCRSYACDKCYIVYKTKSGIDFHLLKHRECWNFNAKEQEKCPKCMKEFDLYDIRQHRESCDAVKCSTCGVIFESMNDLTEHRTAEHKASVSVVMCKFCKREFVGPFNLKKHMRRAHKNLNLYKYSCSHCEALFMHPSKLFAHYFTKHKNILPYTCKICSKMFRLRKQFTIHIKLVHKSIGYVEFDERLHVTFSDKMSEKPFRPQTPNIVDLSDNDDNENTGSCEDAVKDKELTVDSSIATESTSTEKNYENRKIPEDIVETTQDTTISKTSDSKNDSDTGNRLEVKSKIRRQIKNVSKKPEIRRRRKRRLTNVQRSPSKRARKNVDNSDKLSVDFSDDEPLSNVREALLRRRIEPTFNLKSRIRMRNKRAQLTCKICKKYCYTVQNYHHHISLHESHKLKRCIKCSESFHSKDALEEHINSQHASSKLTETLRSFLEKRKQTQQVENDTSGLRPAEALKSLLEQRKKTMLMQAQNTPTMKFRRTIKKVNVSDDCTATITPMTEHGISVKNFIENFRPDSDTISISNSVTLKMINATKEKKPFIQMRKFTESVTPTHVTLSYPVKFKSNEEDTKSNVKVTLVQQMITKPKLLNFSIDERIPAISPPETEDDDEYCNTFADETDYTQYKNESNIPDVAHEVMLGEADDVPRTKQLAQEIIIPNIPEEHGDVRIGHLLPEAPFYKIVKVKKLLKPPSETESDEDQKDSHILLPDGTQLVTVKNPFAHLIPNEHLEQLLKANRNKYYTPKAKNIEKALAKALKITPQVKKGPKGGRRKTAVKKT